MRKILLFLITFMCFNVCALAAHLELYPISGVYSNQYNLKDGSYFSSNQKKYVMDGKMVYCIEPGLDIMTRFYTESLDLFASGLSNSTINKLSLIGYYGYDYPGHHTDNYFLATQELVWEELGEEVYFTTGKNDTGDRINIDFEKNEILSLVNRYYTKPSFDSTYVSGVYHDKIVLVDSNGVLSNYEVTSSKNKAYIDGNKLIVNFDVIGTDELVLTRKKYDDMVSVFYSASNSQDFMFLRANDVVTSSLKIEGYVPLSNIKIFKTGEMLDSFVDGNFIFKDRGLSGIKFELYSFSDIYNGDDLIYKKGSLIETLSTVDGYAVSRNLPNGDYYLKEVQTNDGFILNDEIINISLKNFEKKLYTYKVELDNKRQKISINLHKKGEVFDGVVNSFGSYSTSDLSNIKFGLFSSNPIYNADSKLLVSQDVLIKSFVTDNNGKISTTIDVPVGSYYFKELETKKGYKLDTNIYKFEVHSGTGNSIDIDFSQPIVNKLIKGSLLISKIDDNKNNLANACFRLFDDSNNIISEACTDTSGMLLINDLSYGKYHFYEVSSPDGYYMDDKVYEFNITNDNEIIEKVVTNLKMPVTSDIYDIPKKLSIFGFAFGITNLAIVFIYDKKHKNN